MPVARLRGRTNQPCRSQCPPVGVDVQVCSELQVGTVPALGDFCRVIVDDMSGAPVITERTLSERLRKIAVTQSLQEFPPFFFHNQHLL